MSVRCKCHKTKMFLVLHTCYSYSYLKTAENSQNRSSMRKGEQGVTAGKLSSYMSFVVNALQDECSSNQREVSINIKLNNGTQEALWTIRSKVTTGQFMKGRDCGRFCHMKTPPQT